MAKLVTYALLDPVELFSKQITEVTLKEPTGGQFAELGEPRIWVRNADGSGYWVEQTSVLSRYVEKSMQHDGAGEGQRTAGADLLRIMSLADVMAIKDELLGFFYRGVKKDIDAKTRAVTFDLKLMSLPECDALGLSEISRAFDQGYEWWKARKEREK